MASCAVHLKSKAYFLVCPAHQTNGRIFSNPKAHVNLRKIGIEFSTAETDFEKIGNELAEYDYHGYASLLIFIELECFHYKIDDILDMVYVCFKRNKTLKYVTKIVLNYSYVDMTFSKTYFTVIFNGGCKINFKYPTEEKIHEIFPNLEPEIYKVFQEMPGSVMIKILGQCDDYKAKYLNILRKNIKIKIPLVDNLTVISFVQLGVAKKDTILEDFLKNLITLSNISSIQELANTTISKCTDPNIYEEVACMRTTTNAGCFVFNINPSLAIVINHHSFPNDNLKLDFRLGSEKDIDALRHTFRSKKITYLTINDGSLEDVQAIMRKVRTTAFRGIKNIYLVIMSHGDEGDIIYTKSGSYSIRDEIVMPLLENITLRNVQKFVIVNACRGKWDPRFADPLKRRTPTEMERFRYDQVKPTYPHDDKLMMIFSTQEGCISLRFNDDGCIFVQEFCENFGVDFDEKPMELICQETKQRMKNYIDEVQIPDFQIDEEQPHNIKMEFANFFNNQELLNDMLVFFKTHFKEYLTEDKSKDVLDIDLNTALFGGHNENKKLFGMGYVDGVLSDEQKDKFECYIKSQSAVLDEIPDETLDFCWTNEERTGRSRLLVKSPQ